MLRSATEPSQLVLRPVPGLALCVAFLAVLPALSLFVIGASVWLSLLALLLAWLCVRPVARQLRRPRLQLWLAADRLRLFQQGAQQSWSRGQLRAMVTPWFIAIAAGWRPACVIWRRQLSDAEYRQLAAWLHC